MRTLAITKEFMEVLFVDSDKDSNYTDLVKFLKEDVFGINLICDFSSIIEYQDAMEENPLWELLMDKIDDIKYHPGLDDAIQDEKLYTKLAEHNLFLTSLSVDECGKLSNEKGYIYVSSKDISKTWQPIHYIRQNNYFKVTHSNKVPDEKRFDSWDKLNKYCLPLSSVVIFDRYILEDNHKITVNLLPLLGKLCSNSLKKELHLTIISNFRDDKHITDSYSRLSDYFKSISVHNVKLSLIKHDVSKYPDNFDGLHSRLILTNNIRIKSEDSFNFFKPNGRVNNDSDINIHFNVCGRRQCFYDKELTDIKRYVSRIQNIAEHVALDKKVYYYQDKDNYLFR